MRVPSTKLKQLKRFSQAFEEARDRRANESDTVMYLVKFFEEVLGYDTLAGQITKELAIRDRYCDIALQPRGEPLVLVEAKAASIVQLKAKHIEQAENYASRRGLQWVVLTNGIEWRLYHTTFAEGEGITHEMAFSVNLPDDLVRDPGEVWAKFSMLTPDAVSEGALDEFWATRKLLRPACVVRALFTPEVLGRVRHELNRGAPARLELQDVFDAVLDVVSKDALSDAGELRLRRRGPGAPRAKSQEKTPGRGTSVSKRVSFDVERLADGVRIAVRGRPETVEVVAFDVLEQSVTAAAYAYTDKHIGPRSEVGNKGGSLSNRLRDLLRDE